MEIAITVLRILLGLMMLVVPVNAFFNKAFKPQMPAKAQLLMDTFRDSSYLLSFI